MKKVLSHLKSCCNLNCNVELCSSSRHILIHWNTCHRAECEVCQALKHDDDIQVQAIQQSKPPSIENVHCRHKCVVAFPVLANKVSELRDEVEKIKNRLQNIETIPSHLEIMPVPLAVIEENKISRIDVPYASEYHNKNDNKSSLHPTFNKKVVNVNTVETTSDTGFTAEKLCDFLFPVLEKLSELNKESLVFTDPLDPSAIWIPAKVVKIITAKNLTKVRRNLQAGEYKKPREFCNDVWDLFNATLANSHINSKIHSFATKLKKVFNEEIDPVMKAMGYCCGRNYKFQPKNLVCNGQKDCVIPCGAKYFSYRKRYNYCLKCFNGIHGDSVATKDDDTQSALVRAINKDRFQKLVNIVQEPEKIVSCEQCGREQHAICVLHLGPSSYTCATCLKNKHLQTLNNTFKAKDLPQTLTGKHMENRMASFLRQRTGGVADVVIRVVSVCEKYVDVQPEMEKEFLKSGEAVFPYRSKVILAFQEIEGTDVCFFGLHVQEYGSNCPSPNTRRVYIAYIDSVQFFQPQQYRSAVHHEILLGYLDYVKLLGYAMAHIWVCPPSEGSDYMFFRHPPEQRVLGLFRLRNWYMRLLEKGVAEGVVVEFMVRPEIRYDLERSLIPVLVVA